MRHPDPQAGASTAPADSDHAGSRGPVPWLGGVPRRLLKALWPARRSHAEALRAGYALRRRQEANLQRLACPACRPLRPGADGDSAGITVPIRADWHGTGRGVTYGLGAEAALRPGSEWPPSVVGAIGHEPVERAHGT
jgi:hypothetical protein